VAGAAEVHEQNNKRGARGKQSAVRHYVEAAGDDRIRIIAKSPESLENTGFSEFENLF
jgi:hypothetical protein